MKFAAFISIIISVAVMFAACQGAVGPQGPKGDPGADGTDGTAGTDGVDGTPAFQPLSPKAEGPFVVISDTKDVDGETGPGAAITIDLGDYIRGTADRTYGKPTNSQTTAGDVIFEAKPEGSMLTITPKVPPPSTTPYAVETFTVMISDGGESNAVTLEIPARRSRPPVAPDDDDETAEGQVGTQALAEPLEDAAPCATANGNECYIDVVFTDPDSQTTIAANTAEENVEEKLSFTATSSDTSKFVVVSVGNGVDDQGVTQPLVARVVVRGVASTYDADATQPGHDSVDVIIIATDLGGDTVRGKAQIEVDGQPTADPIPSGTVSLSQTTYTIVDVSGYFSDPESEDVTFGVEVTGGDKNAVTANIENDGSQFVVTRNAPGTAEVTITATESDDNNGPEQTVKAVVTVTSS